jgi:hypothetical protein
MISRIHVLASFCRILLEKLIVTQLFKNVLLSLWNPKVHKSPPLDPILSQPIPVPLIDMFENIDQD